MDAKRLQNVKLNQQSQLGHIGGRMVTASEWLLYRPYKCDCDKKNAGSERLAAVSASQSNAGSVKPTRTSTQK